jgi:hypothetical protein
MLEDQMEILKSGGMEMFRSYWELDTLARHRNAEIAAGCRSHSPIAASDRRATSPIVQLRHHLGVALIQIGQALAGPEERIARHSPPSRPAIWGQPSF